MAAVVAMLPRREAPPAEPQSCGERPATVVDTLCGSVEVCDPEELTRAAAARGDAWEDLCLGTLRQSLMALEHGEPHFSSPVLPWPTAPTEACVRPAAGVVAAATLRTLETVREEGRSRSADEATAATMSRFDFTETGVSCTVGGSFFLELSSDTGAPGALPYHGVWRVTPTGPPRAVYELFDSVVRSRIDPAGDVDGDGHPDWLVREPTDVPDDEGLPYRARFVVATLAAPNPIGIADVRVSSSMDDDDRTTPHVTALALASGAVIVVDGLPHRIERGVAVALPELREEAAAAQRPRDLHRALTDVPRGWTDKPPCANPVRLDWARQMAGPLHRLLGRSDAVVALAGLWACPQEARP